MDLTWISAKHRKKTPILPTSPNFLGNQCAPIYCPMSCKEVSFGTCEPTMSRSSDWVPRDFQLHMTNCHNQVVLRKKLSRNCLSNQHGWSSETLMSQIDVDRPSEPKISNSTYRFPILTILGTHTYIYTYTCIIIYVFWCIFVYFCMKTYLLLFGGSSNTVTLLVWYPDNLSMIWTSTC